MRQPNCGLARLAALRQLGSEQQAADGQKDRQAVADQGRQTFGPKYERHSRR
jgi:hypothetical protein